MASKCDVCEKKPEFGNNVSHSQVKTRRRWNPNIQSIRTIINGTPQKLNACTTCIKSGRVVRRAH